MTIGRSADQALGAGEVASETVDFRKPLAIDLFCGLGGWAEGFLAEGYDVIGFDIERHCYGDSKYPAQLVLQDVLTLDGRQFRGAAVIVASPPCQAYSYRAMPWRKLWRESARMDDDGAPAGNYRPPDPIFNDLFGACFRIAREARVPLIVENVKGAQSFVGPARWHFGSFYLWGDVPALMPMVSTLRKSTHIPEAEVPEGTGKTSWFFGDSKHENRYYGTKSGGYSWSDYGKPGYKAQGFNTTNAQRLRETEGVKSISRKAASAQIAKIPFPLAQYIARVFKPTPGPSPAKTGSQ